MRLQSKKASVIEQMLSPKGRAQRTKEECPRAKKSTVPNLTTLLKRAWKRTPDERESEYIGSPAMRERVKAGSRLSVRIGGNYGVYRTSLKGDGGKQLAYSCTCPSPYYPCKHAAALAYTYLREPESFFDVDALRPKLEQMDKEQLTDPLDVLRVLDIERKQVGVADHY